MKKSQNSLSFFPARTQKDRLLFAMKGIICDEKKTIRTLCGDFGCLLKFQYSPMIANPRSGVVCYVVAIVYVSVTLGTYRGVKLMYGSWTTRK